jgi:TP901 family phage tail tape measure protein
MAVVLQILSKFDDRGVANAQRRMGNLGSAARGFSGSMGADMIRAGTSLQRFSERAMQTGKSLTMGVTVPAAALSVVAWRLGADYDASQRQLQKATEASDVQMQAFDATARNMAGTFNRLYSAQDKSAAMLELAKAGMGAAQIQGGGLNATLLLAAAGGLQLATSAESVSNTLGMFQLDARQAAQVANALAGGANASSASVDSLRQGLAQVGPGARNANMDLQETVATLAAFANKGIQGSDAGTSLKTMLTRLIPTTDKAAAAMKKYNLDFVDAKGNMLPITQVAQQLQTRLSGLTMEQRNSALATIFGSDATRAATVLMQEGERGLQRYITATRDRTAATKMAAAQAESDSGKTQAAIASMKTAAVSAQRLMAPVVGELSDMMSSAAEGFDGLSDGTKETMAKLVAAGVAAGPALLILGQIGKMSGSVIKGVGGINLAMGEYASVAPRSARALVAVGSGLGGFGTAVANFPEWAFTAKMAKVVDGADDAALAGKTLGSTLVGALGPQGIVIGVVAGIAGTIYGLKKLTDALGHADERAAAARKAVKLVAGDADLRSRVDQALGGHYVSVKGQITWKPAVALKVDKGNALVDWIRTQAAQAHAARLQAQKQDEVDAFKGTQGQLVNTINHLEAMRAIAKDPVSWDKVFGGQLGSARARLALTNQELARTSSQLNTMKGKDWRIHLGAHDADLTRTINQKTRELEALRKKKYSPEIAAKTAKIEGQLRRLEAQRKAFRSAHWEGLVDFRIEKAKSNLANINQALEQARRDAKKGVDVGATITTLLARKRKASEELRRLQAQKTEPKVGLQDNASGPAQTLRSDLVRIFGQPITQLVRVQKTGDDDGNQARGGVYEANRATTALYGEAGREIAAFIPTTDPTRAAVIMADLEARVGRRSSSRSAGPSVSTPSRAALSGSAPVNVYNYSFTFESGCIFADDFDTVIFDASRRGEVKAELRDRRTLGVH